MKKCLSLLLVLSLTLALCAAPAFAADAPSDGDVVVDLTFDGDKTEGFTIYTNGGSCDISNENEALCVTIEDPGLLDYANQVYYDGFALLQGCVYTYSFDISSDYERKIQYRIQLNGGDYHAYVGEDIGIGPETQHISTDWTMEEDSDPAPRIVFNMGKFEGMDGDVPVHHISIDNVKLEVKDASKARVIEALPAYSDVAVNQVGYLPGDVKTVFVKDESKDAVRTSFTVVDEASGKPVLESALKIPVYDKATWAHVRTGDFSKLTREGTYHVEVRDGDETLISPSFVIGETVYDDLYKEAFLMLYRQRCGAETDAAIAGGDFAHKACHTGLARVYGTEETYDVSGGWHDAGDYGRYVVPGAKTVLDLMLTYEDYGADEDDLGIPESGNGVPDLLDEARWELEWMLKMQDPATGGVWHKVTCAAFPGEVAPEEETDQLILSPISITATADFTAVMAKASTVYKAFDPDFADETYEAAKKAFAYLETAEDAGFRNPADIATGEYPDGDTVDERILAGVELCLAGDNAVADTVVGWYTEARDSGKKWLLLPDLGWAVMNTYTVHELVAAREAGLLADTPLAEMAEDFTALFAEKTAARAALADAYRMSLEKNYPWGSNMTVANNGMTYLLAARAEEDAAGGAADAASEDLPDYRTLAKQQLDYLLGANSLGYCFVTGFGTLSPEHPHHRPSQAADKVMPGMLIGGPDSNLEDPYARAVLGSSAPAMCYVDNEQSYSCNEITIYWNSPLIYLLRSTR